MNIKVGILNYQYSDRNYGAVLQASAINWYVNNRIAISCEHINFIPEGFEKSFLIKIKVFLGNVLRKLKLKKTILNHDLFCNSNEFEIFRDKWLPRTNDKFVNIDGLKSANFNYDYVIVGSDQVWRPSYTENSTMVFFLSFLSSKVERVSYAASFGNDYWELDESNETTKQVISELKKFKAISVREKSGIDICNNSLKCNNVQHVLDPTLLCGRDFFDIVIDDKGKEQIEEKFLVHYKLEHDDEFIDAVNTIAKENELSVKNIYFNKIDDKYFYIPVVDWVENISKSDIVITDSFHCICLAIIYQKDFLYYPNDNRGISRLESLFDDLGIKDRIYRDKTISPVDFYKSCKALDYISINEKLNNLRIKSHEFLKNALQ